MISSELIFIVSAWALITLSWAAKSRSTVFTLDKPISDVNDRTDLNVVEGLSVLGVEGLSVLGVEGLSVLGGEGLSVLGGLGLSVAKGEEEIENIVFKDTICE